jgi:hypothetical protein
MSLRPCTPLAKTTRAGRHAAVNSGRGRHPTYSGDFKDRNTHRNRTAVPRPRTSTVNSPSRDVIAREPLSHDVRLCERGLLHCRPLVSVDLLPRCDDLFRVSCLLSRRRRETRATSLKIAGGASPTKDCGGTASLLPAERARASFDVAKLKHILGGSDDTQDTFAKVLKADPLFDFTWGELLTLLPVACAVCRRGIRQLPTRAALPSHRLLVCGVRWSRSGGVRLLRVSPLPSAHRPSDASCAWHVTRGGCRRHP